ncbi:hypothetical protein OTU49_014600, partial [Cherax quadricarinatus]
TDAIFPPGYQIMRKDRRGRGGGGVALLVKNRWKFEKMEGIDETGERDYIVGTLQSVEHKVVIAVMYNPPQNCRRPREEYEESNRAMVDTLAEVARRAHSSRAKLLVMGDFNHREIDWENLEPHGGPETWRARMLDVVLENLMHQHVKDTTRVRGEDEPARLDLVFTLGSSDIEDIKYESPLGASDHVVLCFEYIVELQVERITGVEWEKPDYKRGDYIGLKNFLREVQWDRELAGNPVNEMMEYVTTKCKEAVERFIPKGNSNNGKTRTSPWFTRRCKEAKTKCNREWKKYRRQ